MRNSEDVELDFVLVGTLPLMFKDFADVKWDFAAVECDFADVQRFR